MTLDDVLNNIKSEIKMDFSGLKTCDVHDGRFDVKALKRISAKAPAVFVSVLAIPKTELTDEGTTDCTMSLAAYVITKDAPKLEKGVAARNLATGLITKIQNTRWNIKADQAKDINATNLYNGTIDSCGVAMWAIAWRQNIVIDAPVTETEFLPTELYVSIDDAPNEKVIENGEIL